VGGDVAAPTPAEPGIMAAGTIFGQSGLIAGLLFAAVLLGVCGWLLAESLGWYRVPTALAALGIVVAVGLALLGPGPHLVDPTTDPVAQCLGTEFSARGGVRLAGTLSMAPFALFATMATRRPIAATAAAATISGLIEIGRATTGLGACVNQDFLNSAVGIAVAVLVAQAALVAVRPPAPTRRGDRVPDSA
jgi:hypothetical protein